MPPDSFNLLDEPWLVVRGPGGETTRMSICQTFKAAHQLTGLAGDLPTQEVALLRLLLAILYRALPVPPTAEDRVEAWERWWKADELPAELIDGYLEAHRDRFDLVHPAVPFMQVATLSANKTSGLGKLIADQPDGEQFFTTRAGVGLESIDLAEAARWLVHVHAYDPSGIKSGAHGDPRVKGGKGYPIGIGWAGWCGILLPQGRTLKDTLLLSLALNLDALAGASRDEDRPVWERPPSTAAPERGHEEPAGPADLLTWQSRRVRLVRSGDRVTDALISNGDPIHPRNRQRLEPHSAWRRSLAQEKQHGGTVYMPRSHDPERALWRGLPGLLPQARPTGGGASHEPAASLAPGVLEWIAELVDSAALPATLPVQLRAVGVVYGSQSSTIASITEDGIRLRAAVFASEGLRSLLREMVASTETAVAALRGLAGNLAEASGERDTTEGRRERAGEAAYAELDRLFPPWLDRLTPAADLDDLARSWQDQVRSALVRLGDDLVRSAGRPAWVGRSVGGPGSSRHLDSALAARWFRAGLAKALPAATPAGLPPHPTDPIDDSEGED